MVIKLCLCLTLVNHHNRSAHPSYSLILHPSIDLSIFLFLFYYFFLSQTHKCYQISWNKTYQICIAVVTGIPFKCCTHSYFSKLLSKHFRLKFHHILIDFIKINVHSRYTLGVLNWNQMTLCQGFSIPHDVVDWIAIILWSQYSTRVRIVRWVQPSQCK